MQALNVREESLFLSSTDNYVFDTQVENCPRCSRKTDTLVPEKNGNRIGYVVCGRLKIPYRKLITFNAGVTYSEVLSFQGLLVILAPSD